MPNELAWEIEVEIVHAEYVSDEDEFRFRDQMTALGFEPDEIDSHLEALRT
jgi:hypothetical protein